MPKFSDIIGFTASRLHGYCHILSAYHKNNSHTRLNKFISEKNFLLSRKYYKIFEGVFFCRDLLLKDCELFCELGDSCKNLLSCLNDLLLKICGIFDSLKKIYSIINKNFILWRTVIYYGTQEICQEKCSWLAILFA